MPPPVDSCLSGRNESERVNAFGAVNASWTSIAGRVKNQGGRVACVPNNGTFKQIFADYMAAPGGQNASL